MDHMTPPPPCWIRHQRELKSKCQSILGFCADDLGVLGVLRLCSVFQSDLVDQNLLNFLPAGEHSEVYKALSSHVMEGETLTPEYLKSMHTFVWFFPIKMFYLCRYCEFIHLLFSFPAKNQLEFCCHMLRGTIDPKEPPVYEYVKVIGNFKSLNNGEFQDVCTERDNLCWPLLICHACSPPVPNCTQNGFEGVIQRSLQSAFEDRVCLIATVRLAKPQFIKVSAMCFSLHVLLYLDLCLSV